MTQVPVASFAGEIEKGKTQVVVAEDLHPQGVPEFYTDGFSVIHGVVRGSQPLKVFVYQGTRPGDLETLTMFDVPPAAMRKDGSFPEGSGLVFSIPTVAEVARIEILNAGTAKAKASLSAYLRTA